jgi:NADH:ubiquinone oxidoreductase subunit 4 (subunit M)
MTLYVLLLVPLIGSILIALLPNSDKRSIYTLGIQDKNINLNIRYNDRYWIQMIALITSIVNFVVSLILLMQYNNDTLFFQFISGLIPNIDNSLELSSNSENVNSLLYIISEFKGPSLYLGIDGLSVFFVLLTTTLTPICILAS